MNHLHCFLPLTETMKMSVEGRWVCLPFDTLQSTQYQLWSQEKKKKQVGTQTDRHTHKQDFKKRKVRKETKRGGETEASLHGAV